MRIVSYHERRVAYGLQTTLLCIWSVDKYKTKVNKSAELANHPGYPIIINHHHPLIILINNQHHLQGSVELNTEI